MLQRLDAILAKPRHVQLHNRARPTIRRDERFIAARPDESINSRFAIAQDRARCVSRRGVHRMRQPIADRAP